LASSSSSDQLLAYAQRRQVVTFLRMARSIIEQVEVLAATTRASGSGETGRLVIGFCTSLTAGNLRATLLDFKKQFPRV